MSDNSFEPSSKSSANHINRLPNRGNYSESAIYELVDKSLIAHVTFKPDDLDDEDAREEWPVVIPMAVGRVGEKIYLHGHLNSRLLKALSTPRVRACLTFTTVHSIVLARSAFHNSFGYTSAILFGHAKLTPPDEKLAALKTVTNHAFGILGPEAGADRWGDSRPVSKVELDSTRVVEVVVEMASAKTSRDGPNDEKSDLEDKQVREGTWAGTIKKTVKWEVVENGVQVTKEVPGYVKQFCATATE